ncbi:MAG: hypothetical protein QNK15_01795 [Cycloclasticus sp.]|nr:hypothetical protein [Cycloclasticus sp.]
MKAIIKTGLAVALGAAIAAPAFAIDTGVKGLTQNGRVKVGASVMYDLPNQGDKLGPSQWLIESTTTYRPSRTWTFVANFWLRGDLSTEATSFTAPHGGLTSFSPTPTAAGGFAFTGNQEFKLNNCKPGMMCKETSDLQMLNDWEDVIRELSVKYRDDKGRYSWKFGKQQRGWGESDGLRLIDVLHAQDLRERFAFKNSDELRIPALMLSVDFNLSKLGMAGPFEALGMHRPSLEFNFTPEVFHSAVLINNPTPSEKSSAGGAFGLPWPDTLDPDSGSGLVGFGFETPENTARRLSFTDAEYSLRLKFNTLGGVASLNAFYGMQDLPVLKLRSLDLYYNDGANGAAGTGGVIPGAALGNPASFGHTATAAQTEAIVHGAGGYLDWLRSVAATNIMGGDSPLNSPLTLATTGFGAAPSAAACMDPFNDGLDLGGGVPCSVTAQVELDYDYRQMLIGATFTRDLSDFMSFGVKNSSPSIRLEISHEFDHPFNRSVVDPEASWGPLDASSKVNESGSGALAVIPSRAIVKSDITSSMIGFDFPFWVPGWESQEKSIFTSFQLFDIYTHDADKGLMAQAPYAFATVADHQNYSTFLWSMPLDSQRLILEGLILRDFTNEGLVYRQRIDFNYFGDSWRPRIEWMHFSGKKESAPAGIFNNSDFVELSLTYQF